MNISLAYAITYYTINITIFVKNREMELISTRLIYHKYTQDYLESRCAIDTLKDTNLEWNKEEHKNHPYKIDIEQSDIAFVIKDLDKKEEFGFFFFKTDTALEGNVMYTLTRVVLDENLPIDFIRTTVKNVVGLLNNGEFLRKDRIVVNDNYPLIKHTLEETAKKVAEDVVNSFLCTKNNGIVKIPSDMEDRLKKAAQKDNAPE